MSTKNMTQVLTLINIIVQHTVQKVKVLRMNSEGMAERVRPWPQEQRCVHLGDKGMVSDGVESFCEVQGNEVDIVIVLEKTCDLVQKIN